MSSQLIGVIDWNGIMENAWIIDGNRVEWVMHV